MSFAIRISENAVSPSPSITGGKELWGEIEIDDFKEDILLPVSYWERLDYIYHWESAIETLIDGDEIGKIALITEMYDPKYATYINCWPIYRVGETVYVQNRLLLLEDLTEPFNMKHFTKYVDDRDTIDEDGKKISEWTITIAELKKWLEELKDQLGVSARG